MPAPRKVLTDSELAAYRRDGFLVPKYRLPPRDLAALQALTAEIVADNPHLADVPMSCPHVPGSGIQGLKSSAAWLPLSLHPDLLDIVEQIATAQIDDPQHGIRIASDLCHPRLDVIVGHGRKIDELYLDVLISDHARDRLAGRKRVVGHRWGRLGRGSQQG